MPIPFVQPSVPIGTIALWSRVYGGVPYNWCVANGQHGSPDLRNKFIPGGGDVYSPGNTGGSLNHSHVFTSATHLHSIKIGTDIRTVISYLPDSNPNVATGTTDLENNLPPYKSLFWIFHKGRRNYHVA